MASDLARIDFDVHDEPASVRALLERLAFVTGRRSDLELHLDLSKCQYLGPDAVSIIGAILLRERRRGRKLRVTWPEVSAALRGFCDNSGLKELVEVASYENSAFDPRLDVLRLRIIRTASFRDADPIISLATAHASLSSDSEEYLRLCVNEVLQNIEDHADSPIGGVLCARYLAGRDEMRIAIVDQGQGICTTLRRRYPDTTPHNALLRVMEGRFTTRSRENNAGLGMNHLKSIICTLGGSMYIISEEAIAMVRADEVRAEVLPFRVMGTGVFFTLPMTNA